MAPTAVGDVALLSIHPHYAERILDGTKRVELRKRPLRDTATHVVIYATSPVQRIVGSFKITGVDADDPAQLWARYCDVAGIEHDAYVEYYAQRSVGYAIRVGAPVRLRQPMPLSVLPGKPTPPQSVMYLNAEDADLVLEAQARGAGTGTRRLPRRLVDLLTAPLKALDPVAKRRA